MKLKREDMLKWNVKSSEEPGRHTVITPDIHECVYTHIDRLNLPAGENYTVESGEYEYFLSLIEGKAVITVEGKDAENMSRLDGLYLARKHRLHAPRGGKLRFLYCLCAL